MSSSPNHFFNSSSLPSGLHSYAGDVSQLKLRILFTNDQILSRRPNVMRRQEEFESCRDERVNTGSENEGKNKTKIINNNNFHSSYLIKKVRDKWIIEAEGSCLMEDIEDERFELRLLREPLLSLNCNCKGGTCSRESSLHKHQLPSSKLTRSEMEASKGVTNEEEGARNDLFGSFEVNAEQDREAEEDVIRGKGAEEEESTAAGGCLSEKVKLTIAAVNTAKITATTTTNDSSIGTGLTRSKRAFNWKDTFAVTSGSKINMTNDGINIDNDGDYNRNRQCKSFNSQNQSRYYQQHYQKRTLARKLPNEIRNVYDYSSHKNLTSSANLGRSRRRSCRDIDQAIYPAHDSLLSCFPRVAKILDCGSLLLSDCYKEISSDQKTPSNHEAAATAAREIRLGNSDKLEISISDLYLRWLLLNKRQQLEQQQQQRQKQKHREQISIANLLIGQKRLALAEKDNKFDNLLARSSVDDIVDGLNSATALIGSTSSIDRLASGEVTNFSLTSGDEGGNLKARAHLQPHITGYLSPTTSVASDSGGGGTNVGNNDAKLERVSFNTSIERSDRKEKKRMEEEEEGGGGEEKASDIRLNIVNTGEASSEARKRSILIDEHFGAIEKLLSSRALIDPTGSTYCRSHGEILFIMMEKHMTTSLISGGESSISETNFKRTSIDITAATTANDDDSSVGGGGNTNDAADKSDPDPPTTSISPAYPSLIRDAILEGGMINKREGGGGGEGEGEVKEENEDGNTNLKVQNHLGKLLAVKHRSSSAIRADRSMFPDDGESNLNEETANDFNQQHITLADNNKTMPDEIGGGGRIDNSSPFAADKINPNLDSQKASESSNKIINERERKINQTTSTWSRSVISNGDDIQRDSENVNVNINDKDIDIDTNTNSGSDSDNHHELWMQQERKSRRQRQQRRQSMRQTTNQDSSSQIVVVCLGVIVIDTLNKFIQLKPDLNKLIAVDICQGSSTSRSDAGTSRSSDGNNGSTSLGHYNDIRAREAANRCKQLKRGQLSEPRLSTVIQSGGLSILSERSQLIPLSSLVYQLELVEAFRGLSGAKLRAKNNVKLDGRADCDRILNFVREQLLAPKFLSMAPSKPLEQFRASNAQQQVFFKSKKESTMTPTKTTAAAAALTNDPSNAELNSEGFLTPIGGTMLIKLQLSIHFASDFPKDCHNLHVKYKLFSKAKSKSKWKLRRKKAERRMKDDAVADGTLVLRMNQAKNDEGSVATATSLPRSQQEIQKVAQMSHLLIARRPRQQQQAQQRQKSTAFSTTPTSGDEFEKPSAKSTTVFNGHREETNVDNDDSNRKHDVRSTEEALMADHDIRRGTLLLEGSTITSLSNCRGVFHFNCIEELVLECVVANKWSSNSVASLSLSPKRQTKKETMSDSSPFSSTSHPPQQQQQKPTPAPTSPSVLIQMNNLEKQYKSLDLMTKEANYDVLSRELDNDMTTRKRDENNLTAPSQAKALTSSTLDDDKAHDDEIVASFSLLKGNNNNNNNNKDENQQQPVVGAARQSIIGTSTNQNDANENISPANATKDFVELSPNRLLGLPNIADTHRSRADNESRSTDNLDGDLIKSKVRIGEGEDMFEEKGGKIRVKSTIVSNDNDSDDEIQEILVVLEFYSSDFYRDKLQGWSHLTIPINLNRDDHNLSSSSPLSTSSSLSSDKRHQLTWYECTNKKHQLLMPVIRPELSSIIDRLRYFLIGQFPDTDPEVNNFARCHQRYMLQTKQSGKVSLEYEVVRQFSDPNFDKALRGLLKIGKQKKQQQQRQIYPGQTWRPYNDLDYSPYSHNYKLTDIGNSSDEEHKQKQTLNTQQVIDAYQRARQRIDVLNLSSFLETN